MSLGVTRSLEQLEWWLSPSDAMSVAGVTGDESQAPLVSQGSPGSRGAYPTARRLADIVGDQQASRYREAMNIRRMLLVDLLPPCKATDAVFVSTAERQARGEQRRSLGGAGRIVARLNGMRHEHGRRFDESAQQAYLQGLPQGAELVSAVTLDLLGDIAQLGDPTTTAEQAETLLSELLDVCDVQSLGSTSNVLRYASDYTNSGRSWRARRLLRTRLVETPEDPELLKALARALFSDPDSRRDWRKVRTAFGSALNGNPDDAELHRDLARVLLDAGRVEEAVTHFESAVPEWPDDHALLADHAQARTLAEVIEQARADDTIPVVTPSARERNAACFDDATLAVVLRLYRKYGTLCFRGIFDSALLEACHARFLDDYRDYLGDSLQEDALQIGDRRFQVSLELAGPFNDPGFYANPFLLGVMRKLIGAKVIIGSTVCATSLPGARDQHLHKDHRALFTSDVDDEPMPLPPVAVTAMIPLVALDEQVGTTVVKKGSHRAAHRTSERLPSQAPCMPLGSCFLMDLSLSHRGQGNRSDRVRPIVNMQYTQSWFVDNKNFRKQPSLQIGTEAYKRIPTEHRRLFDWATQPGAKVCR